MTSHQELPPFSPDAAIKSSTDERDAGDCWPISLHSSYTRESLDPRIDTDKFLEHALSLAELDGMLKYLWLAGWKRHPGPLHYHIAMGRQILAVDVMGLHLTLFGSGDSELLYVKPMPRFLLDYEVWRDCLSCPDGCTDMLGSSPCKKPLRKIARGFLLAYSGLVRSEVDFHMAHNYHLLPQGVTWGAWQRIAREVSISTVKSDIHERFLFSEMSLSRLDWIHRFTSPLFTPYIQTTNRSLLSDNITWMVTIAVFIALVLTAMQVGLATDRLGDDPAFQKASYVFTVFSILAPIGVFGLVILKILLDLIRTLSFFIESNVNGVL